MARNLVWSLFWPSPPLTPITPVTPVFMSKGHGRGGGGKFFYQKIFSSRNDLIWRENWLAPWHHGWHHGWHHVGTMVGFLAPWSPPLVGRVGGGGGQQSFWPKNIFFQKWSEMAKKWLSHFLSRIKVQCRDHSGTILSCFSCCVVQSEMSTVVC